MRTLSHIAAAASITLALLGAPAAAASSHGEWIADVERPSGQYRSPR
jgi:hypothetical protein